MQFFSPHPETMMRRLVFLGFSILIVQPLMADEGM
jgi:hypothetical protein